MHHRTADPRRRRFHVWSNLRPRTKAYSRCRTILPGIGGGCTRSGVGELPAARAIDPAAYDEYSRPRIDARAERPAPAAIEHFEAALAEGAGFRRGVVFARSPTRRASPNAKMAAERPPRSPDKPKPPSAAVFAPDAAPSEHALGTFARAQFRYADAERHYLRDADRPIRTRGLCGL